ncbi:uncharacterized protein TRIADDRAFT_56071 [Trichoplax adhaerens]|uniref:A-kinase anchor protein 7-like phosphoesterase domain-containing protein n=1 Tax=Trichoplax adhaerens TaxID=10228 RepID=B3RTW7_TRIAD|nr:hypothetical protein TRIADDRAFT_56071 [Trichoplax adhaerens]EDV25697.1 hypothetical protein TRIADDRAFT_56071 [Trichoplax adhaerens]|eukprot:XP_002111730.1 hypothetical protein TRIADDRAFT_56071 [Trichoplax adhaerens]
MSDNTESIKPDTNDDDIIPLDSTILSTASEHGSSQSKTKRIDEVSLSTNGSTMSSLPLTFASDARNSEILITQDQSNMIETVTETDLSCPAEVPFSQELLYMAAALHEDQGLVCDEPNVSAEHGDKTSKRRKRKKAKREQPNYFISLRLYNRNIRQELSKIQGEMIAQDERLKFAAVSPAKIHITLFVMALNTDEEITKAEVALKSVEMELQEYVSQREQSSSISIESISHFNQGVVFAQVKDDVGFDMLKTIRAKVHKLFLEKNLANCDSKPFKPHVTIFKLSKNPKKLKKLGIAKLDPKTYESWKDHHFGIEKMRGLQLCSMLLPPENDGFYRCISTIDF